VGAEGTRGRATPAPFATPTPLVPREEDEAWALVRAALPAGAPAYRPTWLPERFRGTAVFVNLANNRGSTGPAYEVHYYAIATGTGTGAGRESLVFTLGAPVGAMGNTAPPETTERVLVNGVEGGLNTSSWSPRVWVVWREGERPHSVRAFSLSGEQISREEMLLIIAGLAPVAATPAGG
jgi:hypothetical protein